MLDQPRIGTPAIARLTAPTSTPKTSVSGTTTSIDGEGILLTELSHVKYVEFLGKGTNEHDDA